MPSPRIYGLPSGYDKPSPVIASANEEIREAINHLPYRERRIIELRFFSGGKNNLPYLMIGRQVGLSGERVRQILERELKTLRVLLEKD